MRFRCSSLEPFVFLRSGLRSGPPNLLCPLLTSPWYSVPIAQHPASILRSAREISRGKTHNCRRVDAGFTKCTPLADGGLRGHVPARPECTTRLISGFCSSPRSFGFSFFQTSPRGNALAVSLAFGAANTWLSDFHQYSYVPCSAHTWNSPACAAFRAGPVE
jgi:hypothetical protein